MIKRMTYVLKDQRGGIHVLLLVMVWIVTCVYIISTAINFSLQVSTTNKTKLALDQATRASAMEVSAVDAARGLLVWESSTGIDFFYTYLQKNMKLDASNKPMANSFLKHDPIVHVLEGVSSASYPSEVTRSITLYEGTDDEITRNVKTTIYGPSVLAIIEVRQGFIGKSRTEPILVSSASNIRFR